MPGPDLLALKIGSDGKPAAIAAQLDILIDVVTGGLIFRDRNGSGRTFRLFVDLSQTTPLQIEEVTF